MSHRRNGFRNKLGRQIKGPLELRRKEEARKTCLGIKRRGKAQAYPIERAV